jgi:hypothetical protein
MIALEGALKETVMTFEAWMELVEDEFISKLGMNCDSWADQDYWNQWDAGTTPQQMVALAVETEYGVEGLEAFGLEIT